MEESFAPEAKNHAAPETHPLMSQPAPHQKRQRQANRRVCFSSEPPSEKESFNHEEGLSEEEVATFRAKRWFTNSEYRAIIDERKNTIEFFRSLNGALEDLEKTNICVRGLEMFHWPEVFEEYNLNRRRYCDIVLFEQLRQRNMGAPSFDALSVANRTHQLSDRALKRSQELAWMDQMYAEGKATSPAISHKIMSVSTRRPPRKRARLDLLSMVPMTSRRSSNSTEATRNAVVEALSMATSITTSTGIDMDRLRAMNMQAMEKFTQQHSSSSIAALREAALNKASQRRSSGDNMALTALLARARRSSGTGSSSSSSSGTQAAAPFSPERRNGAKPQQEQYSPIRRDSLCGVNMKND